jgi:nucleoside-diphosphate-sugar epimerase
MAVLITGGAGFIGAALAERFLGQGYEVLAFDATDPREAVTRRWSGRVEFVRGDIRDRKLIASLAARSGKKDPIVHLAAMLTAGCDRDPEAAMAINVGGCFNVLEAARENGVRPVIVASTIGVYGRGLPQPIDETMATEPDGWYGVTKVMCEHLGLLYHRRHGLDFRATRFAAVTGAGRVAVGSASLFTSLIPERAALGQPYEIEVSEDTVYPVVYLKDAVEALYTLATAKAAPRRIYNVASGRVVVSEMVAYVKTKIPTARFSFKPDPVIMQVVEGYKEWDINCRRIERDLGWKPAYGVQAMADDIIATARAGQAG